VNIICNLTYEINEIGTLYCIINHGRLNSVSLIVYINRSWLNDRFMNCCQTFVLLGYFQAMAVTFLVKRLKALVLFFLGLVKRALCCFRRRRRQSGDPIQLTAVGVVPSNANSVEDRAVCIAFFLNHCKTLFSY
jgi:hypothetical protein